MARAAWRWWLGGMVVVFWLTPPATLAATIWSTFSIVIQDGPSEGFNDPTPVTPVPGNEGTTLGEQRRNALAAAGLILARSVQTDRIVPISVNARMDPLACSPGNVLGHGAPTTAVRDFLGAPHPATWYPPALANALANQDYFPSANDMNVTLSSSFDSNPACVPGLAGWWYGVGGAAPSNQLSFVWAAMHEIAHGMGFVTWVNLLNGAKLQGLDDVYMRRLEDHSTGKVWPAMEDAERKASAIDTGDLHWVGPTVIRLGYTLSSGSDPGGHVTMYAPNPLAPGGNAHHFDRSIAPADVMDASGRPTTRAFLMLALFRDLGWRVPGLPFFADGFESGSTERWSVFFPPP